MNIPFKEIIWQQFGAAIDDLENTMQACPEVLWQAKLWHEPELERFFLPEFWYIIYHLLFWLKMRIMPGRLTAVRLLLTLWCRARMI